MPAIRDRPNPVVPSVPVPLRVLIVDDHPAVRRGLRELLEDQPDFRVLDAVATAEDAMALAEQTAFDVAVVDYQLGGRSGLWLSRKLKRQPAPPKVIVYSAYCDGPLAAACVVAEADGLVSKGGVGSELCAAIRAVARGELRLPLVPLALAAAMRRRLDAEEQAIFGMLLAGIPPAEIAQTLGISAGWLESRLWSMLKRLEGLQAEPDLAGSRGLKRRLSDG
ncbi:MAG TPA: response regulator transcription factor [Solirubrobacteraceae bacterium]|jgi:DNA-binding NarL/FixJ family response regulator